MSTGRKREKSLSSSQHDFHHGKKDAYKEIFRVLKVKEPAPHNRQGRLQDIRGTRLPNKQSVELLYKKLAS